MFNNSIKKVIGYWIAWVLTIGWATVYITHDDIAQQYKANTWKELTIDESELVGFGELAKDAREGSATFKQLYQETDCNNYEYDFYDSCETTKQSFNNVANKLEKNATCYDNIENNDNLEKSDIEFCISSEKEARDALKDIYIKIEWSCDNECQSAIDAAEYNIAMFQAYLKKLD